VLRKKDQNVCFFIISSRKLGRFWWNLAHRFLSKFVAKSCKRFPPHLTWIMSHTLLCTTWNANRTRACYNWYCTEKNSRIYHMLPPNSPDLNPVDYGMSGLLQEKVYKIRITIWTNWNSDWEGSGPNWVMSSLRQPFVSGVVDRSRSTVFHTPSLTICFTCCYQLGAKLASLETTLEDGTNSSVSFCNNSMVAHIRCRDRAD